VSEFIFASKPSPAGVRSPVARWVPNGLSTGVNAPVNLSAPFVTTSLLALTAAGGGTAQNFADLVGGLVGWRLLAQAAGGASTASIVESTTSRFAPDPAFISGIMLGASAKPGLPDVIQYWEASVRIDETAPTPADNRRVSFGWMSSTQEIIGLEYHPVLYGANWQLIGTIDNDFVFLVPPWFREDTGIPAAGGVSRVLRLETGIANLVPFIRAKINGVTVAEYNGPHAFTAQEANSLLNGLFTINAQKSGVNGNIMDVLAGSGGIVFDHTYEG